MRSDEDDSAPRPLLTVPAVEERATVSTRVVDTGRGVRVNKRVREQEVTVDPPLVEDELIVERVPVGRLVEGPLPRPHADGDTWVVPVLEEVVVMEKRVRLKEEVRITRRTRPRSAPQHVRLKTEEVTVEQFDDSPGGGRHG